MLDRRLPRRALLDAINSTRKCSVALGGTAPPAPWAVAQFRRDFEFKLPAFTHELHPFGPVAMTLFSGSSDRFTSLIGTVEHILVVEPAMVVDFTVCRAVGIASDPFRRMWYLRPDAVVVNDFAAFSSIFPAPSGSLGKCHFLRFFRHRNFCHSRYQSSQGHNSHFSEYH